jgi:arsenite-transporting ATPase
VGRLEELRQKLGRFLPFLRGLIPDLNIVDVTAQLSQRIKDLRAAMTDALHSSYRIVLTPDMAVLKEARRAETYLNLFEYPIDAVVINRVIGAAETHDPYLIALKERQQAVLADIETSFPTLPRLEAPLLVHEPLGVTALSHLAHEVFGDRDPTAVLHTGPTQRIESRGDGYVLRIPMPNVEIKKLSLTKRGDELYVDVGNFRREITLPLTLAALEPGVARVHEGSLEIPFVKGEAKVEDAYSPTAARG